MPSEISELVSLIANAAKVVESSYAQVDQSVPSLNDTKPGSLDDLAPANFREAIQTLEGACAQLTALVARPSHVIVNKMFSYFEVACLRAAVDLKVPDILLDKPNGVPIPEIAKQAEVEPTKLARILRLLASKHCFTEVETDVFANNRLSILLVSTGGLSPLTLHITDEVFKSASMLVETLKDPSTGPSFDPAKTPFNKWSGYPESLFEYYAGKNSKEGAARGARFGLAMQGWGQGTDAKVMVNEFPWKDLPAGTTVCDVGGGVGVVTQLLAKQHPHLKLVLQDLPATIKQAEELWPEQCPEAIKDQRIQFKAMDFFKESPAPNCDVYYNIIHDWPSKECLTILKGIKSVMKPGSKLLIHEYILQHTNRSGSSKGVKLAPEPLLANYGAGRIHALNLDLDMMTMLNSQERYLEDFIKLGEEVGLKFVNLWDFSDIGMVEFSLP